MVNAVNVVKHCHKVVTLFTIPKEFFFQIKQLKF